MDKYLHDWYKNNANFAKELAGLMNFEKEGNIVESKLTGKQVCVTGKLNIYVNRDALIADLEAHGGKFSKSVTAKTDYLVNNDVGSSSSKNKKAKELRIPIIDEKTFKGLL